MANRKRSLPSPGYTIRAMLSDMVRWSVQSIANHPDLCAGNPPPGLLSAESRRAQRLRQRQAQEDYRDAGRRNSCSGLLGGNPGVTPAVGPTDHRRRVWRRAFARRFAVGLENATKDADNANLAARLPLLSISHSHGYALCALCAGAIPSPSGGGQSVLPTVGVDIELIEPRGHNFAADFFTDAEIDCLRAAPPALRELLTTAI